MTLVNSLTIIEHEAQRVLTTEQLAKVYECSPIRISQNFNSNRDRFVEGKHYFKLEGRALKDFKSHLVKSEMPINGSIDKTEIAIKKYTSALYLWTRRGSARHCKMLNTDKAWDMFEELEEKYFEQNTIISDLKNAINKYVSINRYEYQSVALQNYLESQQNLLDMYKKSDYEEQIHLGKVIQRLSLQMYLMTRNL